MVAQIDKFNRQFQVYNGEQIEGHCSAESNYIVGRGHQFQPEGGDPQKNVQAVQKVNTVATDHPLEQVCSQQYGSGTYKKQ
jgi:hypothetical protein